MKRRSDFGVARGAYAARRRVLTPEEIVASRALLEQDVEARKRARKIRRARELKEKQGGNS